MDKVSAIIRIGKETFAAGLFWQAAPTAGLAVREARIVAGKAELAADLFCVRKRGVPQFGLGQRKAGHRAGMRAIAPVLASAVADASWIGVFRTDQGWLYVMVRKGAVMPDGDVLFRSEQEARQKLRSELSIGDWDAVFAPLHWRMEEARTDDIVDLISSYSDARLRAVNRTPLPFILAFCGAAAVCWGGWMAVFPSPPAAPTVSSVPVAPPPPWLGQPTVSSLILACERAIEETRTLPGFEIEMATCGSGGATARYRREKGSVAWLPKNSVVISPDRVSVSTPLTIPLLRRSGEERPMTIDALRRHLWGAAQAYLLDSELGEQGGPAAGLLPGRSLAADDNSGFRPIPLSMGGRLPLSALSVLLAKIPAFVADEVSWQSSGWRVRGKAYVR
ncbi:type 4b pilus protein PilO2 [Telmatospirillum siberiense]|uniref:Type 4b pilus protein PilO2 n=1 Tax=Telmatospirillum siberiense TaxID=382514 RepID=A0A2N3PQY5_9PROT|nr:type 4b pilus protein PilO2 [Telmatospirillum siberiense]PKU22815.1 hypothetical protein CWS72_19355 [Telmatospirillum siberiense]